MMHRVAMVLLLPLLVWAWTECKTPCSLINISFTVESDECGSCITVNTTACAGLCWTQETAYRSPIASYSQNTCNFLNLTYETVHLPGCAPGVDSSFTYPVAQSCRCSQCNTEITDCGAFSMQPNRCYTHTYY
ncbi:Gonadotropin subunit beta-1 [Bagarius yarrelli]|uniref:Gonadotropin subunit beta-1 n=1 Tax=Bagarius yarrelli TaxID=175774 RepID=A0A556TL98_BAGYA|nr:Gonadotropin subunit beta-1 [Bagarius yarrelli]